MSAIEEHQTALRAAGRSTTTLKAYRYYLQKLAAVTEGPWTVGQSDLESFVGREAWGPQTRKLARSAVRSFYRWGHGRGYVAEDPALGLDPVHIPGGRKRWPAPELVVSQLIDDPRQDERIQFMGELAALLGLRVCEIAKVHGSHLDEAGRLVVTGKGGKTRAVPVTDDRLLARLQALGDAYAFPGRIDGHLSAAYVAKLLSWAMPGKWTAHTLRHRFATKSHEVEPDLFALAELLGHASVETTRVYVLTPDSRLRAVAAAAGRPVADTA